MREGGTDHAHLRQLRQRADRGRCARRGDGQYLRQQQPAAHAHATRWATPPSTPTTRWATASASPTPTGTRSPRSSTSTTCLIATIDPAGGRDAGSAHQLPVRRLRQPHRGHRRQRATRRPIPMPPGTSWSRCATAAVPNADGRSVVYHERYTYDGVGNSLTLTDNNGNSRAMATRRAGCSRATPTPSATSPNTLRRQPAAGADHSSARSCPRAAPRPEVRLRRGGPAHRRDRRAGRRHAHAATTPWATRGRRPTRTAGPPTRIRPQQPACSRRSGPRSPTRSRACRCATRCCTSTTPTATRSPPPTRTATSRLHLRQAQPAGDGEDGNGIKTVFSYDCRNNITQVQIGVQAHLDAERHVVIDSHRERPGHDATPTTSSTSSSPDRRRGQCARHLRQRALPRDARSRLGFAAAVGSVSIRRRQAGAAGGLHRALTYDRVGNCTDRTDHLGRSHALWPTKRLNRAIVAHRRCRATSRASLRRQRQQRQKTDALGRSTTYAYDAVNR